MGALTQQQFQRFSPKARAFLRFVTAGKSEKEIPPPERVKMALCAVTDEIARARQMQGVQSEKAGEYAVSYAQNGKGFDLYGAASLYLDEGELYRGWNGC